MSHRDSRQLEPWLEFGRRWEWGKPLTRQESKKAKQKRLRGVSANKRKHKNNNNNINHNKYQQHTTYNQQDLHGRNISRQDAEAFGDIMKTKKANTVRIGLQNWQLLPESSKHYKSRQTIDHLRQGEYDFWLTNEVGLCWPKLDASDQWFERVLG